MGLLDFQPRRVRMELMPGPSVMDGYVPSRSTTMEPPLESPALVPWEPGGLLGLGKASLGLLPLLAGSVTKPEGTSAIARSLLGDSAEPAVVGTVEQNHLAKWGRGSDSLLFGKKDVDHTQKRLREGLTPEEIAEIGFRATQKNAHPKVTPQGDLLLTSPIKMRFSDSPLFRPQALIREEDGQSHLYGVIPKGWKGRK